MTDAIDFDKMIRDAERSVRFDMERKGIETIYHGGTMHYSNNVQTPPVINITVNPVMNITNRPSEKAKHSPLAEVGSFIAPLISKLTGR